jgi:hypothetical protein
MDVIHCFYYKLEDIMRIIAALATVVFITGAAYAQAPAAGGQQQPPPQGGPGMQGHMPGGMRMGMHGDFAVASIEKQLNMTDDQKKHFTQILADIDDYRKKAFQNNDGQLERFFTQFQAEKMSADSLKQISKDVQKIYKEAAEFIEKKFIEFHDMLTHEQRKNATKQVSQFIKSHFFGGM